MKINDERNAGDNSMRFSDSPNYKLASIVLSKRNPFTFAELASDLRIQRVQIEDGELMSYIQRLVENQVLQVEGRYYSLSIQNVL